MSHSIEIKELLSLCCHAAAQAAVVLRSVHRSRLDAGEDILGAVLKDAHNDRSVATVADTRAQKVILSILLNHFPTLTVVAEEEDKTDETSLLTAFTDDNVLTSVPDNLHPSCVGINPPVWWKCCPTADVVAYIDPLDGTREFVDGRVSNVQTLIGIAVKGRPIAGVVGLPFWSAPIKAADGLSYLGRPDSSKERD